LGIWS